MHFGQLHGRGWFFCFEDAKQLVRKNRTGLSCEVARQQVQLSQNCPWPATRIAAGSSAASSLDQPFFSLLHNLCSRHKAFSVLLFDSDNRLLRWPRVQSRRWNVWAMHGISFHLVVCAAASPGFNKGQKAKLPSLWFGPTHVCGQGRLVSFTPHGLDSWFWEGCSHPLYGMKPCEVDQPSP